MKKVSLIIIGLLFLFYFSPVIAKSKWINSADIVAYKNIDDLFAQAELLQDAKKNQEAIKKYNQIIAKDPKNNKAYLYRGFAYDKLENFQRAIDDFSKAIKLKPNNPGYYYFRGSAYEALKDYQKAIDDYSKAIELEPTNPSYYFSRGASYRALNGYQKAVDDFSKAIELEPTNPSYYSLRGGAYDALKDYQKAIDDYSKAIELDPTNPSYYSLRGGAYDALKDYQKAVDDFSKAIELEPSPNWHRYGVRGGLYFRMKNYKLAIQDFTKVIEINPKENEVFYFRGLAYLMSDNERQGMEDIKESAKLGNKSAKEYLAELKQKEENTLKLVCQILESEFFFKVDLVEKTVNGYPANISESAISWSMKSFKKLNINRYTGQLFITPEEGMAFSGKCYKAPEKQF
jgi:tetratricopeptide (TPR) repeat protein